MQAHRAIQQEVAAGLMTLVPAVGGQRLRNRSAAALAWGLPNAKGTRTEPKENRNRATAEGNEPENAGRKGTRGWRTKGENPRACQAGDSLLSRLQREVL